MGGQSDAAAAAPRYARFSRRLRAIFIDWVITLGVIFGAISIAIAQQSDNFSRAIGIFVVISLVLYEPVLVSFTGGTLGHYFANLRVVDECSGGNVSFLKAWARVIIKGLLGWYSFVILAATRRNQAVHDLLTRSTVQIRDASKARPGQYVMERGEPADATMPAQWRRIVVIGVYLILVLAIYIGVLWAAVASGLMSVRCLDGYFCSTGERVFRLVLQVVPLAVLATMPVVIALGWKGRLFGARKA